MKGLPKILLFAWNLCLLVSSASGGSMDRSAEKWWLNEPVRLVQTNLREIDIIDFDVDRYVQDAKNMGANTMLINVGGIVANYPSELDFQYVNPHLKFDVIGRVIDRLHAENIRVIGRFDFSKLNENIAKHHPEWLYLSATRGEHVNYNGQVHTCVNGAYQQDCLFRILDEATSRYDLDGIFFNMIGYQTRDYSGNYHGICQSVACKEAFSKWSGGRPLPEKEDEDDVVFRQYQQFKRESSENLFFRVADFIKAKDADLCICTYTHAGVDLVRMESDSQLDGYPDFEFRSTDNVKTFLGSYTDKQISNTAVHFPTFGFRHASVSPWLTGRRIAENMIHGAGIDYYCIGRLDNQEDRAVLKQVREVFQFHKMNEKYLFQLKSNADVLLVTKRQWHGQAEYKGLIRILTENHILFDIMDSWRLEHEDTPRALEAYDVVVLPDIRDLSDLSCDRLDAFVRQGGKLLATGFTSTRDEVGNPKEKIRLRALGVRPEFEVLERDKGRYFKIREADKALLDRENFADLDIVYLDSDYIRCSPGETARSLLGLIPQAMFGPPEKCYYTEVTDEAGLILNAYGKGKAVYFPWLIGSQYDYESHHAHALLVITGLKGLLGYNPEVSVDGSPLIEISRQVDQNGKFEWLGLLNHSGQLGTAVHQPLPIHQIKISVKPVRPVKEVRLLRQNQSVDFVTAGSLIELTVPRLDEFEVLLFEYKQPE